MSPYAKLSDAGDPFSWHLSARGGGSLKGKILFRTLKQLKPLLRHRCVRTSGGGRGRGQRLEVRGWQPMLRPLTSYMKEELRKQELVKSLTKPFHLAIRFIRPQMSNEKEGGEINWGAICRTNCRSNAEDRAYAKAKALS